MESIEGGEPNTDILQPQVYTYDTRTLYGDDYDAIVKTHPELEDQLILALYTLPHGTRIDTNITGVFEEMRRLLAQGIDVTGALSGGVAGAAIHNLKQEMASQGMTFPRRLDELLLERLQHPNDHIMQVQIGGWPFNAGSIIYKKNRYVTAVDTVLTPHAASKLYGPQSPFAGIAMYSDGRVKFVEVSLDTSSQAAFDVSANTVLKDIEVFIGSSPMLVRDGKPLTLEEMLSQKIGDPRHFIDLPYVGGMKYDGAYGVSTISGSVLLAEFQKLLREGHGDSIVRHLRSRTPMTIALLPSSYNLLKAIAETRDPQALSELQRVGIDLDTLQESLSKGALTFIPQIQVYNRSAIGLNADGKIIYVASSGLLNGRVSGRSGFTAEEFARKLAEMGGVNMIPGCEGRDVPQLSFDGQPLAQDWHPGFTQNQDAIMVKEATTPSTFLTIQK